MHQKSLPISQVINQSESKEAPTAIADGLTMLELMDAPPPRRKKWSECTTLAELLDSDEDDDPLTMLEHEVAQRLAAGVNK